MPHASAIHKRIIQKYWLYACTSQWNKQDCIEHNDAPRNERRRPVNGKWPNNRHHVIALIQLPLLLTMLIIPQGLLYSITCAVTVPYFTSLTKTSQPQNCSELSNVCVVMVTNCSKCFHQVPFIIFSVLTPIAQPIAFLQLAVVPTESHKQPTLKQDTRLNKKHTEPGQQWTSQLSPRPQQLNNDLIQTPH